MAAAKPIGPDRFWRWASGLRFPGLLGLTLVLFVTDLIVPDLIPFVDEVLLGLLALLLGSFRRRKVEPAAGKPDVIDVDPPR